MGVKNVLIEGVSGAGKTTVAEALQRRGHHVVHGDRELAYRGDPTTGAPLDTAASAHAQAHASAADRVAWAHKNWIWDVAKVEALVADRRHRVTFFCGGARNRDRFVDLFDAVFVLDIDRDTLDRRLAERPQDEFGAKPVERDLIRRLHATREDLPTGGILIDATAPVERVVDAILARCG